MLGVLKRRWKPKRNSPASKIPGTDTNCLDNCDSDKTQLKPHQVHPVLDSQAMPYGRPSSGELTTSPLCSQSCYPLTPNICVEDGRIQFIRQDSENTSQRPPSLNPLTNTRKVTVTRGLQTELEEEDCMEMQIMKNRITKLEAALEVAKKNELRDKQTINKLTKQINMKDSSQREADRERRLHADNEIRIKHAMHEASRYRSRLKLLTNEFVRMEEELRAMLAYKKQTEQLRHEKTALTLAFENRCKQYEHAIHRLNTEISALRQQYKQIGKQNHPEEMLQRQAEESGKQYERCLDDVANQVVRALLAQQGLREEVVYLNKKIKELETQNRALASMLVHQLRCESPTTSIIVDHLSKCWSMVDEGTDMLTKVSPPTTVLQTKCSDSNIKHYTPFDSEISKMKPNGTSKYDEVDSCTTKKLLSLDTDSILTKKLSLEDKKRHQVLTKLWAELKGSEIKPRKILEALVAVDSALWVSPTRPVSLSLHFPVFQTKYRRSRSVLGQTSSKCEKRNFENESLESGNKDEGYSTMSSDIQADVTRAGYTTLPRKNLEDLKETSDGSDVSDTRFLVTDTKDPDILCIPLNLLNLNQRNSFPPSKGISQFQNIMKSSSDSHLYIKITTTPSPCYTFSSPISSSSSLFLFDITENYINSLRRAGGTTSIWGNKNIEVCTEDKASQFLLSKAEDHFESTTCDAEYIQHWLRLDETRSVLEQQHRDMLELEYDQTELEDWSLNLSNDSVREQWKKGKVATDGQVSISTLPSTQENNALELEEDSNECLWNNSSYMMDQEGREFMTFLMDETNGEKPWPYAAANIIQQQTSPENSWSSDTSDGCNSHEIKMCSKRFSVAFSGSSDDTGDIPTIGTDFTRDFYRLVKFESTKSLASNSSKSVEGTLSENGEREATLQNVLTFIAEQQKCVASREDYTRPCSLTGITKDFNIEGPPQQIEEVKITVSDYSTPNYNSKLSDNENYVTLKQLYGAFNLKEKGADAKENSDLIAKRIKQNLAYASEICLVTPVDVESENCSNISEHPVDICSVSIESTATDNRNNTLSFNVKGDYEQKILDNDNSIITNSELTNASDITDSDIFTNTHISKSLTFGASPSGTAVSKIPRRKSSFKISISPAQVSVDTSNNGINETTQKTNDTKIPKSKLSHRNSTSKLEVKDNTLDVMITSASSDSSASSCGGSVTSDSIEDTSEYGNLHRIHKYHRQKKASTLVRCTTLTETTV